MSKPLLTQVGPFESSQNGAEAVAKEVSQDIRKIDEQLSKSYICVQILQRHGLCLVV
jgi:hypothetical protein